MAVLRGTAAAVSPDMPPEYFGSLTWALARLASLPSHLQGIVNDCANTWVLCGDHAARIAFSGACFEYAALNDEAAELWRVIYALRPVTEYLDDDIPF